MKTTENYIFQDYYYGERQFEPFTIEYSSEYEKLEQLLDYFIGSTNCVEECYGLEELKELTNDYREVLNMFSITETDNGFYFEIEKGSYQDKNGGSWDIDEDKVLCQRI
jgi:hypothetical protein